MMIFWIFFAAYWVGYLFALRPIARAMANKVPVQGSDTFDVCAYAVCALLATLFYPLISLIPALDWLGKKLAGLS